MKTAQLSKSIYDNPIQQPYIFVITENCTPTIPHQCP